MTPVSYIYEFERGARLKSGDKELVLKLGDIFRLFEYKGYPCVISDGVIYIVKASRVAELKKRSSRLKPKRDHIQKTAKFDIVGHDAEEYLVAVSQRLTRSEIFQDFANGYAYAKFVKRLPNGEVVVWLKLNVHSISASVNSTFDISGWDFLPTLQRAIRQAAKRLSKEHSVEVSAFKSSKMSVANIKMPDSSTFSGLITSYSANWKFI